MFYRRKCYVVRNEFVEIFNTHFNETNLPNQLKHGARLVGRWMAQRDDSTAEIFAIWEYDSYEHYKEIETKIRENHEHVAKINQWYEKYGGRQKVYTDYILKVKNEQLFSTVASPSDGMDQTQYDVQFWQKHKPQGK